MKKAMTILAIFVALLTLFTASTIMAVDGSKGHSAPMFRIENADTTLSIDRIKGEWVLLQFWSSSDPASRLATKQYTLLEEKLAESPGEERFRHVAVNLDRSKNLFQEIVRRDGLNAKSQFYAEGNRADRLIDAYHLEQGSLSAFLIDKRGRIVATNPTDDEIINLMSR